MSENVDTSSSPTFTAIASILAARADDTQPGELDDRLWRSIEAELEGYDTDTDYAELRTLATAVGWELRSNGLSPPGSDYVVLVSDKTNRTFLAYVRAQMLRFDFRFRSLQDFVVGELDHNGDDALLCGLYGLALAGLKDDAAREMLLASAGSPNADLRSRHCCLHGFWLATHLRDQADLLLELSDTMIDVDGPDSNIMFRRAYALRRKGLIDRDPQLLEKALTNVTEAFEISPANPDVNQDYVRERELIALAQMFLMSIDPALHPGENPP
jgi:hypothetical protein